MSINCNDGNHPLNPNLQNPNNSICPSPTPPWHRPVTSPLTNTIYADGTLSLNFDTTYLDSTEIRQVDGVDNPYVIVLPNGNYKRQIIRVFAKSANVKNASTATFSMTGNFVGFTSLKFDSIGFSAVLEWDGANWILIGGNANVIP